MKSKLWYNEQSFALPQTGLTVKSVYSIRTSLCRTPPSLIGAKVETFPLPRHRQCMSLAQDSARAFFPIRRKTCRAEPAPAMADKEALPRIRLPYRGTVYRVCHSCPMGMRARNQPRRRQDIAENPCDGNPYRLIESTSHPASKRRYVRSTKYVIKMSSIVGRCSVVYKGESNHGERETRR